MYRSAVNAAFFDLVADQVDRGSASSGLGPTGTLRLLSGQKP
jgi:hypothetical protein